MAAMELPIKNSVVAWLPPFITIEWSMPSHPISIVSSIEEP